MSAYIRYVPIVLGGGSSSGGGVTAIGTIDTNGASADGATISGTLLYMQSASSTRPGLVNNAAQTFSGAKTFSTAPILSSLTVSTALALDASRNIVSSSTTAAELAFVHGVTSAIQTQLDAKQAIVSIGALDAQAANATGLALVANVLSTQSADATHPGMVNTAAQTFAGAKTFSSTIVGNITGSAGSSTVASTVTTTATNSTNASFFPTFVSSSTGADQSVRTATGLSFNPSTNSLTTTTFVGSLTGNADTATAATTVATTAVTTNASFFPVFVSSATNGNQAISLKATGFTFNPSTATLTASTFVGALTGTATGNTTISGQTNHGVVLASAANAMTSTAAGTSGQPLLSGGASADPAYGTLSISFGGTGQTSKAPAFDALSPMSASGDIIYGGASGTGTRLAKGSDGQVLKLASGLPSWASYIAPTVQKFTTGSGTYTTPAGVLYIRVKMVGGGGGGGGAGTGGTSGGGAGGSTTLGSSLLTATGGVGGGRGNADNGAPGAGGTFTVNSPAVDMSSLVGTKGGSGGWYASIATISGATSGGYGGLSPFGGAGVSILNANAVDALVNTGSGGAGGAVAYSGATTIQSGGGGGAGAYIEAIISAPSATYAYAVGAAGAAGTGTSTNNGSAGGSGVIIVEEYYQ